MNASATAISSRSEQIVCVGDLHAVDVSQVYDQALAASWAGHQTVTLDLSGVTSWSPVAEAMIVGMARELVERRSRLVLTGASLRLRTTSQMDVFNRVRDLGG